MNQPVHDPARATTAGSRWAVWSWFEVPGTVDPTLVYLRRLRVAQTPWFGLYVHWIYTPDRDRDPHDHPWPFVSWVLRGGYVERVRTTMGGDDSVHVRRRWSVHRTTTKVAHSVTSVAPDTVTLVLVGRRCRPWGFWTVGGWVPWREYVQATEAGESAV